MLSKCAFTLLRNRRKLVALSVGREFYNRMGANIHLFQQIRFAAALCAGLAFLPSGARAASDDGSFWSRVTLEAPLVTRHVPRDAGYNDHNWGAVIDVSLDRQAWSVELGDIDNSFRKYTIFAAIAWVPTIWTTDHLRVSAGGIAGLDLNGGYRHHSSVDPLVGALAVKFELKDLDGSWAALNGLGVAFHAFPGDPTALNLALTYRL